MLLRALSGRNGSQRIDRHSCTLKLRELRQDFRH